MIYIIQTNQSLNTFGQPKDFQSCIYKYEGNVPKKHEWDYFKAAVKLGRRSPELKGTMRGVYIGGKDVVETIIDDELHLELLFKHGNNSYIKSQYYLVPEEIFNKFKGQ